MNVVSRRYANAVVLHLHGRLDQETVEAFRADLATRVDEAMRDSGVLVLDCAGLEYVSSAGLRCLMLASRQVKAQKGRILVAALQPMVAEIFEISHFNLMFTVFATLREALASVSGDAVKALEKA